MFAQCSQMSPFRATSFVVKCVANLALSRTIASSSFHVTFVVLPPFVSPKNDKSSTSDWSRTFYGCVHGLSLAFSTALCWFRTRHNPLYVNCPLCRRYFGTYPFELLFQQQHFSLLHCFPLWAGGFVWRFFVGWNRPPLSRSQKCSGHSSHSYVFLAPSCQH